MSNEKRFINGYFCYFCSHQLTSDERMYSQGRCPYCGAKHPDACTIVHCTKRAIEVVVQPSKWWEFWK